MAMLLESEVNRLAVGCLYLLYRRAEVSFPTTTRSHPSFMAVVQRNSTPPLRDGDNVYFPFQVAWFIWESCVYPVLKTYWHRDISKVGSLDEIIESLESSIKNRLIKNGYWPDDGTYVDPDSLPPEAGEFPGLYGNVWWLRLQFKLPDDALPPTT